VTALTVDRRNPDNTLVRFTHGSDAADGDTEELLLGEFRLRLVNALVTEEPTAEPPVDPEDIDALQQFVGIRTLLLAPLFGYRLESCRTRELGTEVVATHEGAEYTFELGAFRARLRMHVREELRQVSRGRGRSTIDLGRVADARAASDRGDFVEVLELLGTWPAPLSIFLRTPEGQLMSPEHRNVVAEALGLLGNACIRLGEHQHGEEVLRLAVQYATAGVAAAEAYLHLGRALVDQGRYGEAVGPLRRASHLGAPADEVWPLLARAWLERGRYLAALAAICEAHTSDPGSDGIGDMLEEAERHLGHAVARWRELTRP
jgi:tetratricopeptide (TPR) repeat protein